MLFTFWILSLCFIKAIEHNKKTCPFWHKTFMTVLIGYYIDWPPSRGLRLLTSGFFSTLLWFRHFGWSLPGCWVLKLKGLSFFCQNAPVLRICWNFYSYQRILYLLLPTVSWNRLTCVITNTLKFVETCIKTFPAALAIGNNLMQVWMNLCYRECFCKTICWHQLHFEFSCQNLNRNMQTPSMWWWLITQPRAIWQKATPGLQRPSHTDCHILGVLYWPKLSVPHLGPDPRYPWGLVPRCGPIIKNY